MCHTNALQGAADFIFLGAIAGLALFGLALCFKGILDELKRRRGE